MKFLTIFLVGLVASTFAVEFDESIIRFPYKRKINFIKIKNTLR